MQQDLPHCHCYCAVMLLPLLCLLALFTGWLLFLKKSFHTPSLVGWQDNCRNAAASAPWWWCCHDHCAKYIIALLALAYCYCHHWLIVVFQYFLKYLNTITCKMARAAAMPLPLYDNVVAISFLCYLFGAVAAWLIVFSYSWILGRHPLLHGTFYCNATATCSCCLVFLLM